MTAPDIPLGLSGARVYKEASSIPDAVEIIAAGRATQFDADVVDAFLRHIDHVPALHQENLEGDQGGEGEAPRELVPAFSGD